MQYERNRGKDHQDPAEGGTASLRVALQELLDRIRRSEIPLDEARGGGRLGPGCVVEGAVDHRGDLGPRGLDRGALFGLRRIESS